MEISFLFLTDSSGHPPNGHCVNSVQKQSIFWFAFSLSTGNNGPEKTPCLNTFHAVGHMTNWKKLTEFCHLNTFGLLFLVCVLFMWIFTGSGSILVHSLCESVFFLVLVFTFSLFNWFIKEHFSSGLNFFSPVKK